MTPIEDHNQLQKKTEIEPDNCHEMCFIHFFYFPTAKVYPYLGENEPIFFIFGHYGRDMDILLVYVCNFHE